MAEIASLKYPARLQSNNPDSYGIVKATEVTGFKQVKDLPELYSIEDCILSESKDNTNNDALGQEWYVQSEGTRYLLVDWNSRHTESGWVAKSDTNNLQTNLDKEIKDRVDADKALNLEIIINKATVDNYTINGYKISKNPVLLGENISMGAFDLLNPTDPDPGEIELSDTISLVLLKVMWRSLTTDSLIILMVANTNTELSKVEDKVDKLTNIGPYHYVGSVESIEQLLAVKEADTGAVYNITKKFTLNKDVFPAGTNVAALRSFTNGSTEADWDALGGTINMTSVTNDINALRNIVLNNHISAWIKSSSNPIEKGVANKITVSWSASISGLSNPTVTYSVTGGGISLTDVSDTSKTDTISDKTIYNLTATIEGITLSRGITVNAYYPIYTFASSDDTIKKLPDSPAKYPSIVSAPNITVSTQLADKQYFCIAVPDGMLITGALTNSAAGSAPAKMVAMGDVEVTDKGIYHCYRSSLSLNAGTYSITYKG